MLDYIVNSPTPVSATEIAHEFDMSISNAYKYLDDLHKGELLTKNKDRDLHSQFQTRRVWKYNPEKINLRDLAQPHLVDLMVKTGQTVHLYGKRWL